MKVVIQNKTTGSYVGGSGKWTSKSSRAFDFEKTMLAFQYCKDRKLGEAAIVFKFEKPEYDLIIPILLTPPAAVHSRFNSTL